MFKFVFGTALYNKMMRWSRNLRFLVCLNDLFLSCK